MRIFEKQLFALSFGLTFLTAPAWAQETANQSAANEESETLPILNVPAVKEFIEADYPPEAKRRP